MGRLGARYGRMKEVEEVTLLDLLEKLSRDTLVGIWNIDDKHGKCPTPQTYQKAENIPWGKIRNIVGFEVMGIYPIEKNGGLLIKVYDKERLTKSMAGYNLAKKIKDALAQTK